MTAQQYRDAIAALGLTQARAARLVGVDDRTSRRWALGECAVPRAVALLLTLMLRYRIDPDSLAGIR